MEIDWTASNLATACSGLASLTRRQEVAAGPLMVGAQQLQEQHPGVARALFRAAARLLRPASPTYESAGAASQMASIAEVGYSTCQPLTTSHTTSHCSSFIKWPRRMSDGRGPKIYIYITVVNIYLNSLA